MNAQVIETTTPVKLSPPSSQPSPTSFAPVAVASAPAATIKGYRVPAWKRVLDIACVLLALPILLPVMILIGLLVKLFDGGPALFQQERVGYCGRRFVLYKFRTMALASDPDVHRRHVERLIGSSHPMVKMDECGDARLLPLGWLLRATGLDELPQIINVLRGEMSLVGPRPCLDFEYERYLPWQRERFAVLPGLTGLWQVSGKNRTTFLQMVRLDIAYSRNMSPWLDLKIIFQTLPALVAQMRETRPQPQSSLLSATGSASRTPTTS
jgi:lipopolysaccharide/colanic/teichoic acid biosynthesis glycosyltransferase